MKLSERTIWKGATLLAPVPAVLVSVGNEEKNNLITVAWTGIVNSQPPKTYISVRKERYSYNMLKETKEFVINIPSCDIVKAVDWCGVKSGKDFDKWEEMSLTKVKSDSVSPPSVDECPVCLECKVTNEVDLGSHTMFLADIVSISVKSEKLDKNGKLRIDKCNLLAYAHGEYFSLGKSLGTFGYSVRKKNKKQKGKGKNYGK